MSSRLKHREEALREHREPENVGTPPQVPARLKTRSAEDPRPKGRSKPQPKPAKDPAPAATPSE